MKTNHALQEFGNLVFPDHGTFSVPSSLDVSSDQLVDAVKGIISPLKKKRKYSDYASKKSAKKTKEIQIKSTDPIPSPTIYDDNHGSNLEEPTSVPKSGTTSKSFSLIDFLFQSPSDSDEPSSSTPVPPAHVQSALESPSYHVSLGYDSLEDDNQDDDNQSEP
ncbi:unnamed protein product [Lactuca saligna]|uniref:Uncharacterized protein n=1 Tax=Lactuca saligna TaxID=75948 RepID=A0AA35Y0G8_LACSI|nr:unnamed protein product [Lactuca saligna]